MFPNMSQLSANVSAPYPKPMDSDDADKSPGLDANQLVEWRAKQVEVKANPNPKLVSHLLTYPSQDYAFKLTQWNHTLDTVMNNGAPFDPYLFNFVDYVSLLRQRVQFPLDRNDPNQNGDYGGRQLRNGMNPNSMENKDRPQHSKRLTSGTPVIPWMKTKLMSKPVLRNAVIKLIESLEADAEANLAPQLTKRVYSRGVPQDSDNFYHPDKDRPNDMRHGYYTRRDFKNNRIFVLGDSHGSLHSMLDILANMQKEGAFMPTSQDSNQSLLQEDVRVVCTGDLLDRSPYALDCLFVILRLRAENPDKVILLAGNHERHRKSFNNQDGTLHELLNEYGDTIEPRDGYYLNTYNVGNLPEMLHFALDHLPASLIAKTALGTVQFNHGSFEQNSIAKVGVDNAQNTFYHQLFHFAQFEQSTNTTGQHQWMRTNGPHSNNRLQWGDLVIDNNAWDKFEVTAETDTRYFFHTYKQYADKQKDRDRIPWDTIKNPELQRQWLSEDDKRKRRHELRDHAFGGRPSSGATELTTYLRNMRMDLLIRGHSDVANLSLLFEDGKDALSTAPQPPSERQPSERLQDEGCVLKPVADTYWWSNGKIMKPPSSPAPSRQRLLPGGTFVKGAMRILIPGTGPIYDMWTLIVLPGMPNFIKNLIVGPEDLNTVRKEPKIVAVTISSCPMTKRYEPMQVMSAYLSIMPPST